MSTRKVNVGPVAIGGGAPVSSPSAAARRFPYRP